MEVARLDTHYLLGAHAVGVGRPITVERTRVPAAGRAARDSGSRSATRSSPRRPAAVASGVRRSAAVGKGAISFPQCYNDD